MDDVVLMVTVTVTVTVYTASWRVCV